MTLLKGQGPASRRKLNTLIGVIPVALFSIVHLWTNGRAMQGRLVFEAEVVPILRSGAFGLLLLLTIHAPLSVHTALRLRQLERPLTASRKVEAFTAAASLLFVLSTGYLYPFRIALGRIDAFDVHPELCAELSATTAQGVPLKAFLSLVGFAVVSHQLTTHLREFVAVFDWPRNPISQGRARAAIPLIGAIVFALLSNGVLYFATGAALF